ncbi:hypothetical protein GJ744_008459 [Endocarpon pusillum]|uniref:FAD-binding domain-containing protein n=1 Tax=Endocarpon pusillum TaxID=364733 RepID=A0A8H7E3D6_9EURO|nr:hypothetical protein GJ744_008459 [Endocarpon pusillum]
MDYIVYERDESETSNRSGGSLDLHPETGQYALRQAGLFDDFQKYASGEGRDAPEIDRLELRKILLASIPKDKIKWGHALTGAKLGADGKPVLQFANGVVVSGFKLAVGTDGAWSKLRALITPAKPIYVGRSYIESRIQPDNPLYETTVKNMGRGSNVSIGSKQLVISQKQGDGSYRFYFGFDVSENAFQDGSIDLHDIEATRRLLLSTEHFGDWGEQYKEFIRHATDFRSWPLYSLPKEAMNWKSVPGVTLAGDAAHLAVPNGEGVNLAMTDSLELAKKVIEYGTEDLDRAVREYETAMFPRGVDCINEGTMMAEVMFSEDHRAFLQLLNSLISADKGDNS